MSIVTLDDIALEQFANVKVVGVGGAGCKALNHMIDTGLEKVDFLTIDTDEASLSNAKSVEKLQIGNTLTQGKGTGASPDIGQQAAREERDAILDSLQGADMVFIAAGMGGGTGAGGAPIVAEYAMETGALVVGIVSLPLASEGKEKRKNAEYWMEALQKHADSILAIPCDRLQKITGRSTSQDAYAMADDISLQTVKGISDLIAVPGLINLDFTDVKNALKGAGSMGYFFGESSGENAGVQAAKQAISSPLLAENIGDARNILFNISGASDCLSMLDVYNALVVVQEAAPPGANIAFGASLKDDLGNVFRVTVIATGFEKA